MLANQARLLVLEDWMKDLAARFAHGPTDQANEISELKKRIKKLEDMRLSEQQQTKVVNMLGEHQVFNENMHLLFSDRLYDRSVRGQ